MTLRCPNITKKANERSVMDIARAADVLERLGLDEFVEDWTLNLERDIG
jgi:hypothetical protein